MFYVSHTVNFKNYVSPNSQSQKAVEFEDEGCKS
jgi:hypothetical protein